MAEADREQRFKSVYEEHFDRVAGYLLARADRDSAADSLARTFEIAWRRLDDVPADPLPWLLGVARRVLADVRRAQRRQEALSERIARTVTGTVDDHAETLAHRRLVLSAIGDLTPDQQEAVLLIAWDGLTERQAAAAVGCTRGAIALRLHRARRQLRSALKDARSETDLPGNASTDVARHSAVQPSTKEAT